MGFIIEDLHISQHDAIDMLNAIIAFDRGAFLSHRYLEYRVNLLKPVWSKHNISSPMGPGISHCATFTFDESTNVLINHVVTEIGNMPHDRSRRFCTRRICKTYLKMCLLAWIEQIDPLNWPLYDLLVNPEIRSTIASGDVEFPDVLYNGSPVSIVVYDDNFRITYHDAVHDTRQYVNNRSYRFIKTHEAIQMGVPAKHHHYIIPPFQIGEGVELDMADVLGFAATFAHGAFPKSNIMYNCYLAKPVRLINFEDRWDVSESISATICTNKAASIYDATIYWGPGTGNSRRLTLYKDLPAIVEYIKLHLNLDFSCLFDSDIHPLPGNAKCKRMHLLGDIGDNRKLVLCTDSSRASRQLYRTIDENNCLTEEQPWPIQPHTVDYNNYAVIKVSC